MSIKGKAYVIGAYEHPLREIPDRSTAQVHMECALGAIEDAGISKDDIDAYFCAGDAPGFGAMSMADYMGLKLRHMDSTETGGSSYIVHAGHAAEAIAAGKCKVALITLAGRPVGGPGSATAPTSGGGGVRMAAARRRRGGINEVPEAGYREHLGRLDPQHLRHVRHAPHVRVRHHLRAAGLDQGRRLASRAVERARHAARGGDGGGGAELADDRRSAAPAGLLRDLRRRRRGDPGRA